MQNDLNHILEAFGMNGKVVGLHPLGNGLINHTFQVTTHEGDFVLQKINSKVFLNPLAIFENMQRVLPHLKSSSYRGIELIKTSKGDAAFWDGEAYWRLTTFISGSTSFDIPPNDNVAYQGGVLLGTFHSLLSELDAENLKVVIKDFHNLELRYQEYKMALLKSSQLDIAPKGALDQTLDEIKKLLSPVSKWSLPVRICHNDTKFNNFLFDANTHQGLCIIDLDTLMPGNFFMDFGDALRTICCSISETDTDLDNMEFRGDYLEAFLSGLGSLPAFLSPDEIKSLFLGAVSMPFLHALRAFTDYLQGNRYYKVNYPKQNKDRGLNMLLFTQKLLENRSYIEAQILQKLKLELPH